MEKEAKTKETPKLKTIEEWAEAKGTDAIILTGVRAFKNWAAGKSVTEKEYEAAVSAFCEAPADGRK